MALMRPLRFPPRFGNDLHISNKLFVLDAGASGSKDMKVLRNHLQEIRSQIVSVSMRACKGQELPSAQPPGDPWRWAALSVWFRFQGTQYEVAAWTCFYLLLWVEEGRAERHGDGREGKGLLWRKF